MNSFAFPNLKLFADWIRQTDDHAEERLQLVDQVNQGLVDTAADGAESKPNRLRLADRLERWRYQHLNQRTADAGGCSGRFCERDQMLVDALDLHANQLRGGKERGPRRPHQAIHDSSLDQTVIANLHSYLDPEYPLQQLGAQARQLTKDHFRVAPSGDEDRIGSRRIVLYAPLYVSSLCVNHCTYCGFRYPLEIDRKHLELDAVIDQARILRSRGVRHQLLVAGDYPRRTSTQYYAELIGALAGLGLEISIEIAAQSTESYAALVAAGTCGVTLYQETYQEALYGNYHIRGPKSSYFWRLEAPDRAAEAGMGRIGLGVLLGLADPAADVIAMLRHAKYLKHRFPELKLALSLPRIHEAPEGFEIPYRVADETLVRLYCVCRLAFPDAELVLSTRESAELRRRLAKLCITQMSAGSCTTPGGYQQDPTREVADSPGEQFPITDNRSAEEVSTELEREGFKVLWSFMQASVPCG